MLLISSCSTRVFVNDVFVNHVVLAPDLALRGWLPAARVASFLRAVVKYHPPTRVDSSDI
jgi:hypothetical protein